MYENDRCQKYSFSKASLLKQSSKVIRPLLGYFPLIALLGYAVCCLFFWVEEEWRPVWDSAIYMLTGRSLAEGSGYTYLGRPFFLRPPGLSWLISFFVKNGSFDFYALNRLIMFFAASTIMTIYFALKFNHGRWVALSVALLAGTSPMLVSEFNWVLSDFPFMALLFLGIGLLQLSWVQTKQWWVTSLVAGICLAAAICFRTVAVLIVPSILLIDWMSKRTIRRWRAWIPALVTVSLVMPWFQYARESAATAEMPSEQLKLFDYATAMFHVDTGDPSSDFVAFEGWLERVSTNGRLLLHDLSRSTLGGDDALFVWFIAAVLIVGLVRVFRSHPSILELFAVFYTIVLLTYFAYDARLVMPLVPMVYLYLYAALSGLDSWVSKQLTVGKLTGFLCGAAAFLLMIFNLVRLPQVLTDRQLEPGWEETIRSTAAWIRNNTPPEAVILCKEAPINALLADRRSYTYAFSRKGDLLGRYDPDFVILDSSDPRIRKLKRNVAGRSIRQWILPSHQPRRKIIVYKVNKDDSDLDKILDKTDN